VQVGGRKAQLNHVYNAHTDGDTWVFFDDANVLDTGDTFGNTGRYNTIDFANGGDIRGLIRAADAFLKGVERPDQDRARPWRTGKQGESGCLA
jgi:cyclase